MSSSAEDQSALASPEVTLTHLDSLPTIAPVALELLRISAASDSDARDLANLLKADQSLSAKVLAVANSPAMGARTEITSLDRAVVMLGFKMVRNIVLAVKIFDCFSNHDTERERRNFERIEFWKHSLGVACAARRAARLQPKLGIDPEQAFLAGLVHDLGKVALETVFPRAYERVASHTEMTRGDVADYERAVLGVDHTAAGRRLAERWDLPTFLQEVIWLHHISLEAMPAQVTEPTLIALVQFADTLVREQRIGFSGNFAFYNSSAALAQRLGISPEQVQNCAAPLVTDVAQHGTLLGLDREAPETMYLKSLARANAELSRMNSELVAKNRRLEAGARHFRALTELDRQLTARAELASVVAAMAAAARTALQRENVAAFGLHERREAFETCWVSDEPRDAGSLTGRVDSEMRTWVEHAAATRDGLVFPTPLAVRAALAPALIGLGPGESWLLPVVHDNRIAGGIVIHAEQDLRRELADETDELRNFLSSLGLAIGRANAHAAARSLSDDLAESNRRLQKVQAELLRRRSLSMITEMATGAGHELNSPLSVISGRAQMLIETTEDPSAKQSLQTIYKKAHECSEIVSELMDFAKPPEPTLATHPLATLLAKARDEWLERSGLPPSRLSLPLPTDAEALTAMPSVVVDEGQFLSVLAEVLDNATYAISGNDGMISIGWTIGQADLRPTRAPSALVPRHDETSNREWVEIAVRDTGCGMLPGVTQRVFDPFYSHRAAGRGRGLGLPRAHRIVEAHGGRILIESQPEEGTTVRITVRRQAD